MSEDAELLTKFARVGDHLAFQAFVERHFGFVHAAAMRQLNGDAHLARDVAQAVFIDAARHAARLAGYRAIVGWLFTSTRYAAANVARGEQRRRRREQEAQQMTPAEDSTKQTWEKTRPLLDRAVAALPPRDRDALLLRFFEQRDYRDIGARLAIAENAARMRVERALERLRATLAKHGIVSTATALAAGLSLEAATVTPPMVPAAVAAAAIAGAAGPGAWLTFMTMTKTHAAIAALAATVAATVLTNEARTAAALEADLREQTARAGGLLTLREENLALRRVDAEARALAARAGEVAGLQAEAQALQVRLREATRRRAKTEASQLATSVLAAGELDTLPKLTLATPPTYPTDLHQAGIEGRVVVELVVDSEGRVHEQKIVQSSDPAFEAAALAAVARWQFEPGLKSGRPVGTRLHLPIVFKLGAERGAQGN